MAEFRPFRGLRYDTSHASELGTLIAPPYDVISSTQQQALYDASPYNVIRLEYGQDAGAERYTTAARLLSEWRSAHVLARDAEPSFYLYEQAFVRRGETYRRRAVIGRVRIEDFDSGVIRPHEYTLSGPKEDRLQLLRATRTNISPVYALYASAEDDPMGALTREAASPESATDSTGQAHILSPVLNRACQDQISSFLAQKTLYIADGHHRYETALRYRDERRAAAASWNGDEPENFVMMAVTGDRDPGLLILPIHRIVHPANVARDLVERITLHFDVETLAGAIVEPSALAPAMERLGALGAAGRPAFVAAGLVPDKLALLTLRQRAAVEASMPADRSAAWKALDVNVLQYGILEPCLGIDLQAIAAGHAVEFTEDAGEAVAAVAHGSVPLAFMLNGTRAADIFAVADAGDRMPQKSTYFYPKLGTGLVLNPLE